MHNLLCTLFLPAVEKLYFLNLKTIIKNWKKITVND